MVELEVLINGLKWAMQTGKIPLVAEGDSQIIINLARRLQSGALTTQVSKNWRWEGRLSVLRQILTGEEAILLSHVKQEGNKVADVMANVGVESSLSFHAKEGEDSGKTQKNWHWCSKLAEDDVAGCGKTYHPVHASDSWHQTLTGRQIDGMRTPWSGPTNVLVANTASRESL